MIAPLVASVGAFLDSTLLAFANLPVLMQAAPNILRSATIVERISWIIFAYFVVVNAFYFLLGLIILTSIKARRQEGIIDRLPQLHSDLQLPVSIIIPAYNEQTTIASSVRSIMQLNYSRYEVLIINDGSSDATVAVLIKEFSLVLVHAVYPINIPTQIVRGVYQSTRYPNLRVIDKLNGGKADALNAGINYSAYPLFCSVDADSVLERDSLARVVRPFMKDPSVIATGGTVRPANGCLVQNGFLVEVSLPKSLLAKFQVVEYIRAFLFGRLGWSAVNGALVISGAFGAFRKDAVIAAGGYRAGTIGEDMELVVRLHRFMRQNQQPYRIAFVPEAICWTEAPEDIQTLRSQRIRWQRGLSESLSSNWGLMFSRNGGVAGHVAFPIMVLFEWLGPIFELSGYLFMGVTWAVGITSSKAIAAFLFVSVGLGFLFSISSLLLGEMQFHLYPKKRHLLIMSIVAGFENFGYRQINSYWRLLGLYHWLRNGEAAWGQMKRKGEWQLCI